MYKTAKLSCTTTRMYIWFLKLPMLVSTLVFIVLSNSNCMLDKSFLEMQHKVFWLRLAYIGDAVLFAYGTGKYVLHNLCLRTRFLSQLVQCTPTCNIDVPVFLRTAHKLYKRIRIKINVSVYMYIYMYIRIADLVLIALTASVRSHLISLFSTLYLTLHSLQICAQTIFVLFH